MSPDQPLLLQLMQALKCLPGVGNKSAQRMAFHLLQRDRQGGQRLGEVLLSAVKDIGHCQRCRTLTEATLCPICQSTHRDDSLLCVVEAPTDILALEQATDFRGRYFVLGGHLSPIDGIGPEELGLADLAARFDEKQISEVILATNPTMEGEVTAQYIAEMAKERNITPTRIAHGVPVGGELEFIDSGTLAHAFAGRRQFDR